MIGKIRSLRNHAEHKHEKQKTERVLIFRTGSIGDTVVALPCFHTVRRSFPNANITLLTNIPQSSKEAPLIHVIGTESQLVDDVVEYTGGSRNPIEWLKLLVLLRRSGFDRLVYIMPLRSRWSLLRDRYFFQLAGCNHLHGLAIDSAEHKVRIEPQSGTVEPEALRLARTIQDLGPVDLYDQTLWDLQLSPNERTLAAETVSPAGPSFLSVNLGGKAAPKDWGLERWRSFAERFKEGSGATGLVVVGAASDRPQADALVQSWGAGAVNLCGELRARESAAAISLSRLFVGHDSGPLHMAASVGVPSLGLFGNYNKPVQWHPFGHKVQVIHELRGMDYISVDQVLARSLEMWSYL